MSREVPSSQAREASSSEDAGALLCFEGVSKSYPDGQKRLSVLDRASFSVHPGDFVAINGPRRSGKSTVMRLAAGIELPDEGDVCLRGRSTATMSAIERDRLLRGEIGLLCTEDWRPDRRERVVDLVALPLLSDRASLQQARRQARRSLRQFGVEGCADDLATSVSIGQRVRVMLARALIREPRLLLIDEPAVMPSLTERDEFYALLKGDVRSYCEALIVASEDTTPLRGANLAMSVGAGELSIYEQAATVVSLTDRRPGAAERYRS